jgi:precorrin-6B methylase 2
VTSSTLDADEIDAALVPPGMPAATACEAASIIATLEHAAWALAALTTVCASTGIGEHAVPVTTEHDIAAARVLVSTGLLTYDIDGGFRAAPGMAELVRAVPEAIRTAATTSTLRQVATIAGIVPKFDNSTGSGWGANDDDTLRAQGQASAFAGQMLATFAVTSLAGLTERFREGGWFLDVGTGVGELGAAFAESLPKATVVGLDVMPRAIALAQAMIHERRLEHRFEVRHQGVEDLDDTDRYDLAWIPAPFIPQAVFNHALTDIHNSLTPGGWIIVGAGRLDGDDLAVSVTRWQTILIGGTPLTASDAHTTLTTNGFTNIATIPTPPGAPALYCGQKPDR